MAILKRRKRNNANICVIGAGRFGQAVINKLNQLNHSIVLIDHEEDNLQNLPNNVEGAFELDASDIKALSAIGIQDFDTVIVGISDNIEIVATLLELGIKNIIARSKSLQHSRILKHIGATVIIRPEEEGGEKAALIATNNNHIMYTNLLTDAGGGFFIGSIEIDNNKYTDISLKKINFSKLGVSIIVIKRKNRSFLPSGNAQLRMGDIVTFIGEIDNITTTFNLVNSKIKNEIESIQVKKKDFINS